MDNLTSLYAALRARAIKIAQMRALISAETLAKDRQINDVDTAKQIIKRLCEDGIIRACGASENYYYVDHTLSANSI